jgi:bacterial leucyl aminopeptidase
MSECIVNSTVSLVENSFNQPNVVARLNPPKTNESTPTILLGGHLVSKSPLAYFHAPGADDDASGTAVMLLVMSILSKSGWIQKKSR